MSNYWTGETDCPRCGGTGSLVVHGETASLEIDGCWICGFGKGESEKKLEFIPLNRITVEEQRRRRIV